MEEDFCLLGLLSDEPDYRLCWLLNQALEINLEKEEELILYHPRLKLEQSFSLFAWVDEDTYWTYRIIRNRSGQGYFLEEVRNIDYLLHLQGEISTERLRQLINSINEVVQVRMCVPVDLQKIRNKERLMIW